MLSNASIAKNLDIMLHTILKKFCNYSKNYIHIIKECPIRPPKKIETTFTVVACPSTTGGSVNQNAFASAQPMTPEMVQQMIISAFSTFGLSGKPFSSCILWYFDSDASNHMTNGAESLKNITRYYGNLQIHIANGNSLPIATIGDISSSLTNCFVFPGLTSNLISVGQLVDNDCKVAFSKFGCLVQDQQLGKMITKGPKVRRLFPLYFS